MRYKIKLSGASPGTNQIVLPDTLANYFGDDLAVWYHGNKVPSKVSSESGLFRDDFNVNGDFSKWDSYGGSVAVLDGRLIFPTYGTNQVTLGGLSKEKIPSVHFNMYQATLNRYGYYSIYDIDDNPLFTMWTGSGLGTYYNGSYHSFYTYSLYEWCDIEFKFDWKNGNVVCCVGGTVRAIHPLRNMGTPNYMKFTNSTSWYQGYYIDWIEIPYDYKVVAFNAPISANDEIEIGVGTSIPFEPEAANSADVLDWRPATGAYGTYWYFPRSPFYAMKVKVDSTWKQIADMKVKIAGEWKDVEKIWHKQDGTWHN